MSFILDALRKSEAERQVQDTPGFADVPHAPQRAPQPVWVWAIGALLAVNILVLIGVLLRSDAGLTPPLAADTSVTDVLPARIKEPAPDGVVNEVLFSPLEAEAHLELGNSDQASLLTDRTLAMAERHTMSEGRDHGLRVRGSLRAARGDWEASETDFATAIAGQEARDSQISLVDTLIARGLSRKPQNHPAATEDLERAREIAEERGLAHHLTRALAALEV